MRQHKRGFTLIELMVVVAIIAILTSMAIPTFQEFVVRAQITEAINLSDSLKKSITEYYTVHQQFPENNQMAGLPKPEHLIGNFVSNIEVQAGAIHILLGNRINVQMAGKILTLRPAVVTANPSSPISWLCGYANAVSGMTAVGNNKTTIPINYLSMDCR